MFAIFRKRASKLRAELVELRKKEEDLAKRAQAHVNATDQAIDALIVEMNQAQAVVDDLEEYDILSLYRTDDDLHFKRGDVVHIRNPEGPALPVLVPRTMTRSEAREYGLWMLAKYIGRDPRPHRKMDQRLSARWPGNLQ
jgi:predicted ATPase